MPGDPIVIHFLCYWWCVCAQVVTLAWHFSWLTKGQTIDWLTNFSTEATKSLLTPSRISLIIIDFLYVILYYKRILISAQAHNGLRLLEKYFRWLLAEGDWLSETSSSHLRKHPYRQNSGYYFDPEVLNFCLQDISDSSDDNFLLRFVRGFEHLSSKQVVMQLSRHCER